MLEVLERLDNIHKVDVMTNLLKAKLDGQITIDDFIRFPKACKVLGKNPEKWLTYVLKNIGKTKKEDLHKLLPQEWEEQ